MERHLPPGELARLEARREIREMLGKPQWGEDVQRPRELAQRLIDKTDPILIQRITRMLKDAYRADRISHWSDHIRHDAEWNRAPAAVENAFLKLLPEELPDCARMRLGKTKPDEATPKIAFWLPDGYETSAYPIGVEYTLSAYGLNGVDMSNPEQKKFSNNTQCLLNKSS